MEHRKSVSVRLGWNSVVCVVDLEGEITTDRLLTDIFGEQRTEHILIYVNGIESNRHQNLSSKDEIVLAWKSSTEQAPDVPLREGDRISITPTAIRGAARMPKARHFRRRLQHTGWTRIGQKGSHEKWRNSTGQQVIVVEDGEGHVIPQTYTDYKRIAGDDAAQAMFE